MKILVCLVVVLFLNPALARENEFQWLASQTPPNEVYSLLKRFRRPLSEDFVRVFPSLVHQIASQKMSHIASHNGVCEKSGEVHVGLPLVRERLVAAGVVLGPNEHEFLKNVAFIHGCGTLNYANHPAMLRAFFDLQVKKVFVPEVVSLTKEPVPNRYCEMLKLSFGFLSFGETYLCYDVSPSPGFLTEMPTTHRGFLTWGVHSVPIKSNEPIYYDESIFMTMSDLQHLAETSPRTNLHFIKISRWESVDFVMKMAAEKLIPSRVNEGINYLNNLLGQSL